VNLKMHRYILGATVGMALLGAWVLGRAQGSAAHDFQIEIAAYGGNGSHDVSFICQKGCDWTGTNFGCGREPCRYILDGHDGLRRNMLKSSILSKK
jgi:hypothetical protein